MPNITISLATTTITIPDQIRGQLTAGRQLNVRFSPPERRAYHKRKPMPVSEWCAKHRVVTMSSLPGPWKNSVARYLSGIMDASFFPSVRDVSICKSPQTGGSEAINNCIAYAADRSPGPALYVYPDELTARENCQDRITPMFTNSPRLRSLLSGRDDDSGALKLKLSTMPIYMAWSRSVSRLANKPCRFVVFDETDKYQATNEAETDPIRLGEARVTTFRWTSRIWKISSPTTEGGYIWQSMLNAQVIFEYVVTCPHCRGEQVMVFGGEGIKGGIKWPEDNRDPDAIELSELAWYECEHCGAKLNDHHRDKAVQAGYWRAKGGGARMEDYLEQHRPRRIAFHVPAWLSTFVSLSKIAAAYLRCKSSGSLDLNAYKDFCNRYLSEPWHTYHQPRQEDRIMALCDDRPPGLVPGGGVVAGLFAGIDTQGPGIGAGFYFVIRAYGWSRRWDEETGGLVACPRESWLIRRGFVESFAALEQVLTSDVYADAEGNAYPILRVVQDAMGHRTKEVYDFCRQFPGWAHPFKGERKMGSLWKFSQIDTYPGTNKPIPGGVQLLRGNVTLYKNSLATALDVAPGDPGCRWLHASVDALLDYGHDTPSLGIDRIFCGHLVAEYCSDAGFWECPQGVPNHYWDCEVYADIAADVSQVAMWSPPQPGEPEDGGDQYQTSRAKL